MRPNRERPLRVAYPISSLRIGGAELRALALAERLPRDRFEVDFLCLLGEGPLDDRGRLAGARVHHLGGTPLSTAPVPARIAGRLVKFARYAALAAAARYDIVDAWLHPTDVFVALGRHLTRTPIVVSGRFDLLPRHSFGPFSARIDTLVNNRVDAIVANSEAVAAANRGRYGVESTKLHVIRNGVEPAEALPPEERRRVRAELGAGDTDVLVGTVGMLRNVKRHTLLVDAFADVAKTDPRLRLAIIGEGPMRPQLERQVEQLGLGSRVRLPGATVDARSLVRAFDIVALSSLSEGMPNALLEAASAGRPIVTTAAGGAVEVVLDGVTGLVVPVEDRSALGGALARLVTDPDLRKRFGAAGRQHIEANFGMDRFVHEWTDLYERLAASKALRHRARTPEWSDGAPSAG